ncbi:acetoacetate metabolism regulatory protein AtoC [Brevibacillus reuszeri]|uniref:Regulator n=1 Tax=Brevibacillus reuszeri TaxID=54915 RepID=A0A0K9YPX6_9BACL|nr:sigma-54 dependent transcriptional regulator [Brevibacillus reuszeri]KNB70707.1 regulator [Brevibacillus reuszeri]MED1861285.1 sigma-54 dependent transcriptional regulator [Brevibacillus reuszeri]GED69827.1 acetoacetate metabolism regulatory protein AtoC [Brevibacillus reuszeri]
MNILIIDDERAICSSLSFALEDVYGVLTASGPEEGLRLLDEEPIDGILLDLNLRVANGIDLLRVIKERKPEVVVIMMTAYGSIESSVEAIKAGAYHYLSKPLNLDEVKLLLSKAFTFQQLHRQVQALSHAVRQQETYAGIIGKSSAIQKVFQLIEKVKDINSNVLITGESGTGKELVARAIHFQGGRQKRAFSVINCAAIPELLLESELFGHEKGAFTGAYQKQQGLFERSDGGTIFLDEIGEMPLSLQAKILRVIQEKVVTPVGSQQPKEVDVRIISATNRNLQEEVAKGSFREDLYYRLNVIPIHLPPLRERKEDVPLLIEHFLAFYSANMGVRTKSFSPEAKRKLYDYTYPGNVRELSNMLEYAVALSEEEVIHPDDLPEAVRGNRATPTRGHASESGLLIPEGLTLAEAEKMYILYTLEKNERHRLNTAKQLSISERGLREKLKQYARGPE